MKGKKRIARMLSEFKERADAEDTHMINDISNYTTKDVSTLSRICEEIERAGSF